MMHKNLFQLDLKLTKLVREHANTAEDRIHTS